MDSVNGVTYDDFHKFRIARYPSLANIDGSNFDNMMKWKDDLDWGLLLELDEQAKAKSIDYAHGLELDDIGDDIDIERAGLDDELYRFYIKLHRMLADSKGTFPDISNILANLLGCSPNDIRLSNDRKYNADGDLVGENNTINIDSIDITKVNNPDFVRFAPQAAQSATLASTKVKQVGFYAAIPVTNYVGTGVAVAERITIEVPDSIEVHRTAKQVADVGVGVAITESISIGTINSNM